MQKWININLNIVSCAVLELGYKPETNVIIATLNIVQNLVTEVSLTK